MNNNRMLMRLGKWSKATDILKSLDIQAFYKWCEENVRPFPMTNKEGTPRDEVALAALHKARLFHYSMSVEERQLSKEWLIEHGYKPAIFDREL